MNFYNVHAAPSSFFHGITKIVQLQWLGGFIRGRAGAEQICAQGEMEKTVVVFIHEASLVAEGALLFSVKSLVPHRGPASSRRCFSLLCPYGCSGRGFLTPGTMALKTGAESATFGEPRAPGALLVVFRLCLSCVLIPNCKLQALKEK